MCWHTVTEFTLSLVGSAISARYYSKRSLGGAQRNPGSPARESGPGLRFASSGLRLRPRAGHPIIIESICVHWIARFSRATTVGN
jgi:hypothetical protein